ANGELPGLSVATAGDQIQHDGYPEFRGTATFSWRKDGWGAGVFVSHVGSMFDTGPAQVAGQYFEMEPWTTVSLYGQYAFKKGGVLDGSTVRFGVRNVEDKDPPLYSNNVGYLGSVHNSTGRYWYSTFSKRF
ncbi:MAG: hypothetical protein Q8K93_34660, partial [Reyranella sp.]|nr:hypothetical protein [Reyranella sp.]